MILYLNSKSIFEWKAIFDTCINGLSEMVSNLSTSFVSYDDFLLEITTRAIRIFSLSYIISGLNIFSSSFFTALHNGPISTAISFLRTLLFQIAFIFILPLIWGIDGIWLAVVLAEAITLFFSMGFLIANRKKYKYG